MTAKLPKLKVGLGFKDLPEIATALDVIADKHGIDRSDVLRMMVRNQLSATNDSNSK
jgi:metal-responsive CopG/Arc/MetJ family transcriptional regulator